MNRNGIHYQIASCRISLFCFYTFLLLLMHTGATQGFSLYRISFEKKDKCWCVFFPRFKIHFALGQSGSVDICRRFRMSWFSWHLYCCCCCCHCRFHFAFVIDLEHFREKRNSSQRMHDRVDCCCCWCCCVRSIIHSFSFAASSNYRHLKNKSN